MLTDNTTIIVEAKARFMYSHLEVRLREVYQKKAKYCGFNAAEGNAMV